MADARTRRRRNQRLHWRKRSRGRRLHYPGESFRAEQFPEDAEMRSADQTGFNPYPVSEENTPSNGHGYPPNSDPNEQVLAVQHTPIQLSG